MAIFCSSFFIINCTKSAKKHNVQVLLVCKSNKSKKPLFVRATKYWKMLRVLKIIIIFGWPKVF
jgi:hypothetical protein